MKRIGIFLLYDTRGRVYEYVEYLLQQILPCLDELVVVSNGFLLEEGRETLRKYTDKILERPNVGFDAAGWKAGMLDFCGMEHLRSFDELILFNDSYFGPLYPFQTIFDEMDSRELDFWGMTSHGAAPSGRNACPYGDRPQYIQTYFMGFRGRLLRDPAFESYWRNLPTFTTFSDLVEKHGCVITQYFSDLGFRWDVYCDTRDLESEEIRKNFSYHMFQTEFMLRERKLPFIKRKTFIMEKSVFLRYGLADSLARSMRYIEEHTDYDTRLIWDYLLDNYNLYDLNQSLNLTRVFDNRFSTAAGVDAPVALIAHLFYEELFDYCLGFIRDFPEGVDIYLTTTSESKKELLAAKCAQMGIRVCDILVAGNRGRELAALLVSCHGIPLRYKYLCFYHDKKSTQKEFASVGSDFGRLLTECILGSRDYVCNILQYFEQNPRLGLLVPPNVYHGSYFASSVNFWTVCYEETRNVLCRLNLDESIIEKAKPPFSVGTAFWCRVDALRPLFEEDWQSEDFPREPLRGDGSISHALERCFPYIAQSQRYYTCTVMPLDYAETEIANFRYMMDATKLALRGTRGLNYSSFYHYVASIQKAKATWGPQKPVTKVVTQVRPMNSAERFEAFKLKCKAVLPTPFWNLLRKAKRKVLHIDEEI